MSKYAIEGATLTGIADAVRRKGHTSAAMTPAQITAGINALRIGVPVCVDCHINPATGVWERPEGWPNLDVFDLTDYDGVYLTYDLSRSEDYRWIGLYGATASGTWTVERGHIANGAFVADETHTLNSGAYFRQALDIADGGIQLWRAYAGGHFTQLKFATNSTVNAECYQANMQPCVERVGRLPWVNSLSSSVAVTASANHYGTIWLERDAVREVGKNTSITSLNATWYQCLSLQSLDIGSWDTSGWAVTTLQSTWNQCLSLQSLDIGSWDTSGWAVTTMYGTWYQCFSLQRLNIGSWDTSSWAVTTLQTTWYQCLSLQSLDIGSWDTSGWAVTTLQSTWNQCLSLQSLDIGSWDTSGWAVTSLYYTWNQCLSLQSLDIGSWDTSGWAVTDNRNLFAGCDAIRIITLPALPLSGASSNYAPNLRMLTSFNGIALRVTHSYANALVLSHDSLLAIIDRLPTVTGQTITLGQVNKLKLTAAEIAVATGKGWTVA